LGEFAGRTFVPEGDQIVKQGNWRGLWGPAGGGHFPYLTRNVVRDRHCCGIHNGRDFERKGGGVYTLRMESGEFVVIEAPFRRIRLAHSSTRVLCGRAMTLVGHVLVELGGGFRQSRMSAMFGYCSVWQACPVMVDLQSAKPGAPRRRDEEVLCVPSYLCQGSAEERTRPIWIRVNYEK